MYVCTYVCKYINIYINTRIYISMFDDEHRQMDELFDMDVNDLSVIRGKHILYTQMYIQYLY
jgi:hypothetical protein